ncbi:MAG: hypothetical protein ABIQ39_05450 [Ilumatobacteraceae bacterium]
MVDAPCAFDPSFVVVDDRPEMSLFSHRDELLVLLDRELDLASSAHVVTPALEDFIGR